MRITIVSVFTLSLLLLALASPAVAGPELKATLTPAARVTLPQAEDPQAEAPALVTTPRALPSFGFVTTVRPALRAPAPMPRLVLPQARASGAFQGFGAVKPPVFVRLTRPSPGVRLATEDAASPVVRAVRTDEGLPTPRCDGYNPCHAGNNPAALARKGCAVERTCDAYTPCAPRRRVVRRYVVRSCDPCYSPCASTYYAPVRYVRPYPYYRSYYGRSYLARPYWGGGWGGHGWGGHGWGVGIGFGW